MQGALEGMRARRSGLIVNISSVAAKDPLPSKFVGSFWLPPISHFAEYREELTSSNSALYAGSKAALEAVSETLAKEVAEFGIAVLIVNPGAFRTNFLGQPQLSQNPLPDDYKNGVVGSMIQKFMTIGGTQAGDPDKGIERIFEIVTGGGIAGELKGKVLRLIIGEDALTRMKNSNDKYINDLVLCEKVAQSTAFD